MITGAPVSHDKLPAIGITQALSRDLGMPDRTGWRADFRDGENAFSVYLRDENLATTDL